MELAGMSQISALSDLQSLQADLQKSGNIRQSDIVSKGGKLHVLTINYTQPNGSNLPVDLVLDLQWKSPDFQVYLEDGGWSADDPMSFVDDMIQGKQIK